MYKVQIEDIKNTFFVVCVCVLILRSAPWNLAQDQMYSQYPYCLNIGMYEYTIHV